MEIFAYSTYMTDHVAHMAGQMQTQLEAQRVEAKQREEAQRAEAERREEAQRSAALTREQMLIQMKTITDQTSADRKKAQIEANQKREQAQLELSCLGHCRSERVDSDGEEACDPYRIAQCQLPVHR